MDRITLAVVYVIHAVMSIVFAYFLLLALSENGASAILGVSFFVGCALLYGVSDFFKSVFKAYMKITMHIVNKLENLLISK